MIIESGQRDVQGRFHLEKTCKFYKLSFHLRQIMDASLGIKKCFIKAQRKLD
jgi:hypothetical protein